MSAKRFLYLGLFAMLVTVAFVGCRKKEDTIAIIKVRDAANQAVEGARVVIYGQSTTGQPASVVLYDTTTTNADGEAIFNFNDVYQLGQAGVAVLNIDVQKVLDPGPGSLTGQGIIKIEQEVTTEEIVFVQ